MKRFLDSYLASPIIRNDRDKALLIMLSLRGGQTITSRGSNFRVIRQLSKNFLGYSLECLEPENYRWLMSRLDVLLPTKQLETTLGCVQKVAQHADIGLSGWGVRLPVEVSSYGSLVDVVEVDYWFKRTVFFETYINKIGRSRASGAKGIVSTSSGGLEMRGDEYLVVLTDHSTSASYLLAYSQVLMLKDMCYSRANTIIACQVLYPDQDGPQLLNACFDWALRCLEEYGNRGYELVKAIEALAKTNITRKAGGVFSTEGPHEKMVSGIQEKERGYSEGETPFTDELDSLLGKARSMEMDVEIFGLQKLSGHPLVDPYTGGKKVRDTSRKRVLYRPSNISRLRNNFCRMYLEGYIRRSSTWPPLVPLEGAEDTRLYQLMLLNELRINASSYPLEDWEFFKYGHHHNFDYYPNFLDLMDDKSISYYRDQFMATWDRTIRPRSHKRLLIEMLSRPEVTIRDIVERVRKGDIPFSWMIVSLYPKEREFKLDPRMFGMMVFEMRAFFTCTEANIAECVFPNLPPQTMTLSKIQIQELFQDVTADHGRHGGVRLYEEFDLSGWNGHFHDEVVDPIAMDLEDMFDLPGVFSVIHHFFKESIMSVRVRECVPPDGHLAQVKGGFQRSMESNVLWPDHDAGIEGLAQKIWTCPTYSMFDLAMQKFGVKYYIIGQADNQTCTAWIPESLSSQYKGGVKELALEIAQAANSECQAAGHELNLDECLHSTEVITYSKDVYVQGVEYYTSLKALSRVFPHSASDFPSIANSIGAISGQCLAAAERCKNSLKAYWLCLFHMALYLNTLELRVPVETIYLTKSIQSRLTPGLVACLLEYPGEMGGLPVGHLMGFLYKGGADPLSKASASCKLLCAGSRNLRRVMCTLSSGRWFDQNPDKGRLLDDPYSLPLKGSRTPEMSILADSVARVKGLSKNKDIFQMLSFTIGEYESNLRLLASSVSPLNPVLSADIVGLSLVGVSRTALKMFTSTQTIQSLLQGDEQLNPCQKILTVGAGQFLSLVLRLERVGKEEKTIESAYEFTCMLRKAWLSKEDPDLVGVSVVTPVDLAVTYEEPPEDIKGFKVDVRPVNKLDLEYTRGPQKVYFGRATKEHRSEHGYRIITSSSPELAVSKLAKIATQPGIGPGMMKLLEHVVSTRGNMSLIESLPFLGSVYGGMVGHRYQSRLGNLSANIMGVSAQSSHCTISTDTADPISGGSEDYPIMVQEGMVAMLGLVSWSWPFPGNSCSLALRTDRREWLPLSEEAIDILDPKLPVSPDLPRNPLIYAEQITLERSVTRNILPMIGLLPITGKEGVLPYSALCRRVWRQLNRSHTASAVADRGVGRVHLDLDIAEVSRIGGRNVVKIAALAVAQFSIDALFSRSEKEYRWTPLPVLMSLSRALSDSLAIYVRHPLVQKSLDQRDGFRDSGMTYKERKTFLSDKICRFMVNLGMTLFNDSSSILYEAPLVMFYDDPEGEAWRSLAHVFKRSCLQSAAIGEIPMQTAYLLVRRNLTSSVMGKRTDLRRSQRMAQLIGNTLTWAKGCSLHQLSASLSNLSKGLSVIMTQCALSEALRLARRLELRETPSTPPPDASNREDNTVKLEVIGEGATEIPAVQSTRQWEGHHSTYSYDLWTVERMKGRVYGFESSVAYSYVPISSDLKGKSFVNVGCGYGAGAALLLLGGATMCYGLDLKQDVTPEARLTGQHVPMHVTRLCLGPRFLRIGWTQGWNGDIRRREAVRHLTSSLSSSLSWVCDIPLPSLSDLRDMVWTITTVDPMAKLYIRILGTVKKAVTACSFLSAYCLHLYWIPVCRNDEYTEGWAYLECNGNVSGSNRYVSELPGQPQTTLCPPDLEIMGGGREYLLEMATGGLSACDPRELETSVTQIESMIGAASGELEHRFSYNQWTDVINALICIQVVQHEDPLSQMVAVLSSDTVEITSQRRTIPKVVDFTLRRLLTHVVSRYL